jgi:ligand-binding SRPBCC domain-containing protein
MRLFTLERELAVPRPLDEVHAFFADPSCLAELSPPWLALRIVTPPPRVMRRGAVFDIAVRVHGVPLRWRSLISAWEPPHRFVDEQTRGPFRAWIHEHRFDACAEGTRIADRVRYAPLGGALADRLFVRPDLERIFAYRAERMRALFG